MIVYPLALRHLGLARVNLLTADLRMLLADSTYTPVSDSHQWLSDVSGEIYGPGYTAGGQALTGREFDYYPAAGAGVLHCDDIVWQGLTGTFRWVVLYANTGDPGSSPLLSYFDTSAATGSDADPGGQPVTLTFPDGVLRLGAGTGV